ncbi:TonB-dependent receptor [Reyranella sp.]|uniref:TonB-dependent receptor n=1 Tax=Reyranella sp. TaxID=1929291 RepID=UPI003F716F15
MQRIGVSALALAAGLSAAQPAFAQSPQPSAPPNPTEAQPATLPDAASGALAIEVVGKRLDRERSEIQPSLGATRYDFSKTAISNTPQGENAPLNQVLLRAPGVVQDGFGQIHVRGDHGSLQYRLDGVQLPEGLALFSSILSPRFADQLSLITGALPAQYGLRTAGVVDIAVKSGTTNPGGEASMMTGSYNWLQPALQYGGRSDKFDYFAVGQYVSNGIGIENPTSSTAPLHDDTAQWYALTKLTALVDDNTRLSFIGGGASARYQIPNVPGQAPSFPLNGITDWNSALLDQRQWEDTYFGIASLQKSYQDFNLQLSGFARYSKLSYQPDALGDLLYNGIAPWSQRSSLAVGAQGDASWKVASNHTLRGGFLVQRERVTSFSQNNALGLVPDPADPTAMIPGTDPVGFTDSSEIVGWTYSVYLQDEWKVIPNVTINFGARFDAISGQISENQVSPRINVVWEPTPEIALRAGYSRYFVPAPLNQVGFGSLAVRAGTTAEPENFQNDPVKAERSDYFDVGLTVKPVDGLTVGFSGYYKIAENYLDKGQFGAPVQLASFNYANAQVKGFELYANYDKGPWSLYGNLAWSKVNATNITSAQYNFSPGDLAYIGNYWITADHDQGWTGSAGAAYVFNSGSDWATRVSADMLFGSGLRTSVITPNDTSLPAYATLNLSVTQKVPLSGSKGTQIRLDAINVTDGVYELRTGEGVGVGAPQYGMRRAFFVTLAQKF